MMKRFFLLTIISVACLFAMAQTQTVTHVVQRGETIESIAKQYHVSVDDINKANPNADGMVYVGMKLVVPVGQAKKVQETTNMTPDVTNEVKPAPVEKQTFGEVHHDKSLEKESENYPLTLAFEIGYGFISGSSNFQYEATIGVNYCFPFNLYAGARIGYNSGNYNSTKSDGKGRTAIFETKRHFIEVPLEIGYALTTSNKIWGIVPFAGINTNIGLTSNRKYKIEGSDEEEKSQKVKVGGKLGFEARLGLRLRLTSFNISGSYRIPLNDNQKRWFGKDGYPEITIGFGF